MDIFGAPSLTDLARLATRLASTYFLLLVVARLLGRRMPEPENRDVTLGAILAARCARTGSCGGCSPRCFDGNRAPILSECPYVPARLSIPVGRPTFIRAAESTRRAWPTEPKRVDSREDPQVRTHVYRRE
jgi:hypothetical protein